MFNELNFQSLLSDSLKEKVTDLHLNFLDNQISVLGLKGDCYSKLAEIPCQKNESESFLNNLLEICSLDPLADFPQDGKIKARVGGKDSTIQLFYVPMRIGQRLELRII